MTPTQEWRVFQMIVLVVLAACLTTMALAAPTDGRYANGNGPIHWRSWAESDIAYWPVEEEETN